MKLFQNPLYIPLVQKPECCSVTCLQMILYRRLGKLFDLQELAVYFGVKVDEENLGAFNVKLQTLTNFNYDEGIPTIDSEDLINNFFSDYNLNLKAKSYKFSQIKYLKDFIGENLKNGNDLWIEYHTNEIHNYNVNPSIHDSLIESIFDNEITLIDPEYHHKPKIKISLKTIEKSISNYFGKETGIIVVSNK